MEIVFPCFSSSTTVCTESRPRRISQPAAYRREAEEAVGIYPLAECHSTHVSAKIRALNRAECVIETLRHALNVLAIVAPVWLRSQVQPEWLDRYGHRAEEYRLPTNAEKRQALLHQVGQDGWGLLTAIQAEPTSHWMLAVPAIDTLQRVWKQDYLPPDQGGTWIPDEDRLPAAKLFYSPYDLDASAGTKRSTHWIGYTVHFTETCDEELPRLITQGTTTIAPTPDRQALPEIHEVARPTGVTSRAASSGCRIYGCRGAGDEPDHLSS